MEIQINKKCTCEHSTGSTHIECCNICGLPLQTETIWHFFLPEDILSRVEPLVMQLLADITENKLLVRPSLVGGWWVSKWKGVTGLNEAYCNGVIGEGKTILEAVNEWKKLSEQSV